MGRAAVPTSGFLLPDAHVPPAARGQPGARGGCLCAAPGRGPPALPSLAAHCSGRVFRVEKSRDSDQGPGPLRSSELQRGGQPWQPEARGGTEGPAIQTHGRRVRKALLGRTESESLYGAPGQSQNAKRRNSNPKNQHHISPKPNARPGSQPRPAPGIRLSPSGNTWAVTGATGQYAVAAGQPTPPGTAGLNGCHTLPLWAAVPAIGDSRAGHHFITGHWWTSLAPRPLGKERGWVPRCSPGIFLPGTPSPLVGTQLQCDALPEASQHNRPQPLPGPREHSCPSRSPQSSIWGRAQRTGASHPASFTPSAQRSEPWLLLLTLSGLF